VLQGACPTGLRRGPLPSDLEPPPASLSCTRPRGLPWVMRLRSQHEQDSNLSGLRLPLPKGDASYVFAYWGLLNTETVATLRPVAIRGRAVAMGRRTQVGGSPLWSWR
jgi:hypothetical protein